MKYSTLEKGLCRSRISGDSQPQNCSVADGSNLISLPTEICEAIIDELVESPETLRACALVCHFFAQRAQKHLFSCICLTLSTKVSKAILRSSIQPSTRFLQILSSSPHLAGYVKSLIISDEDPSKCSCTYHENSSWIRKDNVVQRILPLLPNLEELGLAGYARNISLNFFAWGNDLHMGILEQCSSDRLVKIRLAYIRNVPLSLVGLAPRLETLRLKGVSFILDSDHTTAGRGFDLQDYIKVKERYPPARLKDVSVTSMSSEEWRTYYPWLASRLDLTHIETLELNIDFGDAEEETIEEDRQAIWNLLNGCSATLETLWFFMPPIELEELTPIDLPNQLRPFDFDVRAMPVLRNLHLNSWIWCASTVSIPDIYTRTPSPAPLPQTALRALTSIVSQTLPSTRDDGEHNRGSNSSSYPPHTQLEALTLHLIMHDYLGKSSSRLENMGWEEFAGVVEELAGVRSMSLKLKSKREAMKVDVRSMVGRETMLGEVYPRPMMMEIARGVVGATSVIVVVSLLDGSNEFVEGLLEDKLGWLREKGVGLGIHAAGLQA